MLFVLFIDRLIFHPRIKTTGFGRTALALVGWVEQRVIHHLPGAGQVFLMGCVSLHPYYKMQPLSMISKWNLIRARRWGDAYPDFQFATLTMAKLHLIDHCRYRRHQYFTLSWPGGWLVPAEKEPEKSRRNIAAAPNGNAMSGWLPRPV